MRFVRHLLAWLRRNRLDDQLREELLQHREWTAQRLMADGVPEAEARRRAALHVGNPVRLREQSRAVWGFPTLETIAQDVRYGLRLLARAPLFTAATVGTLGLTIGATSALFAVANAVVWRPLAFPQSDRIVSISTTRQGTDIGRMDEATARIAMASGVPSFESFALYDTMSAGLTGGAEPARVVGARVSQTLFDLLRVRPVLGRSFTASEMQPDGPTAMIVSESLWTSAFGRDPDVLGRTVSLDDRRYSVIGVMPAGFRFPSRHTEFWLPLLPRVSKGGGVFFAYFVGRLRPGIPVNIARTDVAQLRDSRARDLPAFVRQGDILVISLHDRLYGDFRTPIVLLLGAVVCVLLIGCANVANLLLAREAARRHELAIRSALGASRGRIIRQLLIESLLLALLGDIPALAILYGALRAFLKFGPVTLTTIPAIAVDVPVSAFLAGVTIAVGLLFGLAPAFASGRSEPRARLDTGLRTLTPANGGLRRVLVTLEVAAAAVVVIGASLLVKSLVRFESVDPGFHADDVLTASVALPRSRYANPAARRVFFDDVIDRVRALPGVESAAFPASWSALSLTMQWSPDRVTPPTQIGVWEDVGASNFRTFGIPMLSGRECRDREPPGAKSAVLNARMARLAFDGRPAVGQTLNLHDEGTFTIIGVAPDVIRDIGTKEVPLPMAFLCAGQEYPAFGGQIAILARSGTDPASLASALRKTVAAVDPELPITDIATVPQLVDDAEAPRRFDALLFGAFALIAFALAVFGLYAVTAYLVAQRTREFGVRIALGADRGALVFLVLRQGLAPAVTGVGLGLVAAIALTRLLQSMLFAVSTLDAGVFVAVPIGLVLVACGAAAIPALRAARVDPVQALRTE
jgi:putative ABC transport system permease protein